MNSATPLASPIAELRHAARFWEYRRLFYNLALFAVTLVWILASWPHFRPAFAWAALPPLLALALLANLCYSAVYLVELPLARSAIAAQWIRWRWALWVFGTLFAVLLENYRIADEIFPYV